MQRNNFRYINYFILKHRLLIFLITLLSILLIFPFVHQYFPVYLAVMELLFSIILIAGIFIVSANREILTVAILLGMLAFTVIWFNLLINSKPILLFGLSIEIVFFALTTSVIISHVLSYKRVTADKIYGAICGYLLIGIMWALLYTLLESAFPGSFRIEHGLETLPRGGSSYAYYFGNFIYYSFVTLTTLGYGDITPISNPSRVISSLEAVVGQLYVAVLIARLVGLHIGHSLRAE